MEIIQLLLENELFTLISMTIFSSHFHLATNSDFLSNLILGDGHQ